MSHLILLRKWSCIVPMYVTIWRCQLITFDNHVLYDYTHHIWRIKAGYLDLMSCRSSNYVTWSYLTCTSYKKCERIKVITSMSESKTMTYLVYINWCHWAKTIKELLFLQLNNTLRLWKFDDEFHCHFLWSMLCYY